MILGNWWRKPATGAVEDTAPKQPNLSDSQKRWLKEMVKACHQHSQGQTVDPDSLSHVLTRFRDESGLAPNSTNAQIIAHAANSITFENSAEFIGESEKYRDVLFGDTPVIQETLRSTMRQIAGIPQNAPQSRPSGQDATP